MINFASGGSESFVNAVPEPGTLLLLASGVAALRFVRRRALSID